NEDSRFPVAASQVAALSSSPEAATRRPSGLNASENAGPPVASGGVTGRPVAASHKRHPDSVPVAMRRPSGLNDAPASGRSWRIGEVRGAPVRPSHTRAVPSLLAVTTRTPSGEKVASTTAPA